MIMIDPRDGSGELEPYFRGKGVETRLVDEMPAGDFAFEGNSREGRILIGVERKAIKDMITSIRGGRLSGHQLLKMREMYGRSYVIVEGIWGPAPDGIMIAPQRMGGKTVWNPLSIGSSQFMYSMVDNYITSMEESYAGKLRFRRSSNKEETAHQIVNLYKEWQKDPEERKSHDAFVDDHVEIGAAWSTTRLVAKDLPGVGAGFSKSLEKHFGSVEEMVKASEQEWAEVELPNGKGKVRRVGPALAKRIYNGLRGA